MKKYQLQLSPKTVKNLRRINQKDRLRIAKVLLSLQEQPYQGKKLEGELRGLWSVRVWPFRIVYRVIRQCLIVLVINVARRKDVYR